MKGIYTLMLYLGTDKVIRVGKLGGLMFKKGYYTYVGSAMGTGGFKRVQRHFNVASGKNKIRKWHIDYLLPHTEVVCAILFPTEEIPECTAAKWIGALSCGMSGFGCTDCSCGSHLFFSETRIMNRVSEICSDLTGIESIIIRPDI